ncbi:hypothetical protein BP6252_13547 [Coleophoma cylindrospora]|uniref:Uncharacterized protein n=1 Tax=Coleophoma cylindrospora TaxID=1849047 RepID=A0A3D8Q8I9_9HELO|nr:hypothetical protein BP6252_13547 [Coleophoma cylindrospora]
MASTIGKRVKAGWKCLDLDSKTFYLMLKGSIPVVVSLGFYQSTAVSEVYTTLGFLVSIISVATINILPRAKLVEMTFTICLFTAFAIPITMLATWSGLQARLHTDPEGLDSYNSSQSAISGIWLFFNIMLSNSLQARYPALLIATILYNIFMIVQLTSCSRFDTWAECWHLIYLTTKCYYTGVAISFVSGLIFYPVTCRSEIFELQEKYLIAVRGMLDGTSQYLGKLETTPTFPSLLNVKVGSDSEATLSDEDSQDNSKELEDDGKAAAMKQKMAGVKALYTKMHQDLIMAKREIAWGKLGARDINAICDLCRKVLMPLSGMAHLPDILKRIEGGGGWIPCDFEARMEGSHDTTKPPRNYSQNEYDVAWKSSVGALLEPTNSLIEAIKDGLEHAGLQLEIIPRPGTKNFLNWIPGVRRNAQTDVEAEGELLKPGSVGFSKMLEDKLSEFKTRRVDALTAWENSDGLTEAQREKLKALGEFDIDDDPADGHVRRDRQQLYLILYIQHMIYTTGIAVLELAKFSDKMVAEGVMSKNRLIVPSFRRLSKWLVALFDRTDASLADDDRPSSKEESRLLYGVSRRITHDIEHLPPRNAYERFGVRLRRFQEFLAGPELSFGFRSACAAMSCAIVAYLRQTQDIFTHYRFIWAVILATIGSNMSAGQSGVSTMLRVIGSFAALIICYIVWYIPVGHVAGVIVLMWFAAFLQMYVLIKYRQYTIGWLVTVITEVLSIGYELQVKKIGIDEATSTGIIWYRPYDVVAMRVACVLWGTAASVFFTYFPFPFTARGLLRKQTAIVIELLANFHTVIHATIKARLRGAEGDMTDKKSLGRHLMHTRKAMFNKMLLLSSAAKHNVYLQKYEPTLGGRFPVAMFEDILSQLTLLLDYMSLLSFATEAWESEGPLKEYFYQASRSRAWLSDLAELIGPMNPTEERITSILGQLSAAVAGGRALSMRIETSKPYQLSEKLRRLDPEILDVKHMQELGYSAYAVMEIISSMITHNLNVLVVSIESLVGIVAFDFGVIDENWKGKSE